MALRSPGFLAVQLSTFRLDRCGWDPHVPAILVVHQRGAERVVALSPPALAGGVRPGMTLAEARGHLPTLHVERLDPAAEARDLTDLAATLVRYTPQVRAVPPERVLLEAGPEVMRPLRAHLASLGHASRLVWTVEARAALILARYGNQDRLLRREDLPAALAPLPVEALFTAGEGPEGAGEAPPEALIASLHDIGIRTVGAFAALPPAALAGRYGPDVAGRHALARGEVVPVSLPLPPPRPESACTVYLPEPVEVLEALLFVVNGLVRELCGTLDELPAVDHTGAPGAAIVRVQLRLGLDARDGNGPGEVHLPVRLGRPGRNPDRLFRILRARLERITLPAPVVSVQLELLDRAPFRPMQPSLYERAEAAEPLPELVARLRDTLGEEVVCAVQPADTWRPEGAWRAVLPEEKALEPALASGPVADALAAGRRLDAVAPKVDPAAAHDPLAPLPPRPVLLSPVSEPVRVLVSPSGRPRALLVAGAWVAVGGAEGPERLAGSWWEGVPLARDYWRLDLADGRRLWVYRDGAVEGPAEGRWWLHGWFDQEAPGLSILRARSGVSAPAGGVSPPTRLAAPPRYAELICRSNFSFCEGASHPDELIGRAKSLGLAALAVTDRDGLYGSVQAHRAAKEAGVPLIHGALLTLALPGDDGGGEEPSTASVVALVQDQQGWGTLCRLLTAARLGGATLDDVPAHSDVPDPRPRGVISIGKGYASLPFDRLLGENAGLIVLARGEWAPGSLEALHDALGDRLYRAVSRRLAPDEGARIERLRQGRIPCVAVNDVLMHDSSRQQLQDVLTCIRIGVPIPRAGRRLQPNGERVLMGPEVMARRFAPWPDLLERTMEIAGRCDFSLDRLKYRYPREVVPEGVTAQEWLHELCRRGLPTRYPQGAPEAVTRAITHELGVIERLGFASYFLTVHDLVRYAREQGILCQGRGSAANSAVCYVLGVTAVDPASTSLLFERFISEERGEPPDIDVDFEHERREEVLQYAYRKYGRDRAAMVNEVIAWRGRSAVRDVATALGYGLDQVDQLAKTMGHWGEGSLSPERLREAGLDPTDPLLRQLATLVGQIQGFPRHTSIHVGGFVISDDPLIDIAPLEPARMPGRTVLQWDKNDIDELGFVKVDLLSLGMLTAIRKCFTMMRSFHGVDHDLATVPREDPAVYDMLCEADSIGVFQVESRAQQSMLPRLRPRCFYDLVVETAIVRPGPIQGGMVHPYLRRRNGEEPITYAHSRLEPILARTMGVPIFQEQVMAMAMAVGGFTPGESDTLRRAMGAWRKRGGLGPISEKLRQGMAENGIQPEYAEQILKQIQGFAEYGFPESHAASFAHLVYVSSWQRCHYPAAFCAALLNSQPMGFYAPRSLVADAQRHGVEVRPVDVAWSDWDCTLERGEGSPFRSKGKGGGAAIRLGMRLIRGMKEEAARVVMEARRSGPFRDVPDFASRTRLGSREQRLLARADALRGLVTDAPSAGDRIRAAAWAVDGLWPGLFTAIPRVEAPAPLPHATPLETVQAEYAATGMSVERHPLTVVRERLAREGFLTLAALAEVDTGAVVRIAGLVSHRQRPATASGVVFMTLEDETGTANLVVWPKIYERQRVLIRGENLLSVSGKVERQGKVLNVIAWRFWPLDLSAQPYRKGAPRAGVVARSRDFR